MPEAIQMDQYVTGAVIRELRERQNMTQAELAEKISVSDKAVSRWETGKGYPDITLIEPIAAAFGVSVTELFAGTAVSNTNLSSNMLRSKLYVCPVCGNVMHSMGEAVVSCHGIRLLPEDAEIADEQHKISVEISEDEYYVHIEHPMTKTHYISFLAAFSSDRMQLVKLYPEGVAQARFKINGVKRIYYFCNRDGLYYIDVKIQKERKNTR